uniref:Augmin subunit 4 n=1 Tax=Tanacetum cinerariifolium TaxID=118510 RepID=A0A6L2LWG7_TANCI|nr:augmin subunit 4 [Tanacetum cinerariifolium]
MKKKWNLGVISGVEGHAKDEEIKLVYGRLVKYYHPDGKQTWWYRVESNTLTRRDAGLWFFERILQASNLGGIEYTTIVKNLKLQHQHKYDELQMTWLCKSCGTMSAKLRSTLYSRKHVFFQNYKTCQVKELSDVYLEIAARSRCRLFGRYLKLHEVMEKSNFEIRSSEETEIAH